MAKRMHKSMTIRDILRYVPYEPDTVNARHVSIVTVNILKRRPLLRSITATAIPGESVRRHKQTVAALDPKYKGLIVRTPIKFSCTCGRHLYQWEHALYVNGAADIVYSNGQPPVTTNPSMIPACCKHGFRLFKYIVQKKLAF